MTPTTTWTPKNVSGSASNTNENYQFFGTLNKKNQLMVYAPKVEGKARQAQSKRALNRATIEDIVSGKLQPLEGRKHFDVSSLNDPACPLQADYLAACEKHGKPVAQPA